LTEIQDRDHFVDLTQSKRAPERVLPLRVPTAILYKSRRNSLRRLRAKRRLPRVVVQMRTRKDRLSRVRMDCITRNIWNVYTRPSRTCTIF